MKRLLLIISLLTIAVNINASVKVVALYYNLNSSDNTAEVTYYSANASKNNYVSGDLTIPETIESGGKTYSVTSIGSYAFYGCLRLTSVTIPNSVTSIGDWNFRDCSGLTSVIIGNSVTSIGSAAFFGCSGLTSVTIPNSVTSIGDSAFFGCSGLTSVTIPNSVTSIGDSAFYGCSGLTSVTISNSVTSIGEGAFSNCKSLPSVTIPNSVTSIGDSAFSGCSGLTSVTIPNSVKSIGNYAFSGCSGLTNVTIGNSVTSIGNYAFSGCSGLTSVTIPNSVTSIGNNAFNRCSSLKEVTIEDGESTLSLGYNFSSGGQFGSCPLEKVYIGRNLSYYSGYYDYSPFANQRNLTDATIGTDVTSINDYLFYNCSGLQSITIPHSVTSIGNYAFYGCDNLQNIIYDISSEFASFASEAFDGAHFKNTSLLVPYPEKTLEIHDNPNWNKFQHIYYFLDYKKYVPIIWDNPLITDNAIFSNDKGCLVEIGTEVTLRSNEEVVMATHKGESIKDELDSPDGFSFLPCEKWEENIFFVIFENSENSRNVIVSPAGNLFNEVGLQNIEKITSLKISGYLNGTDIMTINRMTSLVNLDISDASIVEGGQTYRENLKTENDVIGKNFFSDCKNLKNLVLSNTALTIDNSAFEGMNKLINIVIGTNTQTINERAFYNCSSLNHITIPNSVTSIGNSAFDGCTSLKEVTIEDGGSTLALGYNNSSSGLFGSSPLEKVYLGRNLSYSSGSSYGYSPFANQKNLTEVTIGNSVTSLEDYLFYNCSSVTSVAIPNSVTSIGSSAFEGCSALTYITIPNSVTSIGDYAFNGCSSIKEVIIEDGESTLNLGYNSSSSGQFGSCPLEKVYIGRNLSYSSGSSYGYSPFANQKNLIKVTIGTAMTSIGDYLFYNCSSVTNVTICNSVISIGIYAFSGCSALTYITIPNSVTSIGNYAFSGCSSIKEVTIEDGESTLSLGYNSSSSGQFGSCPLETVYVGRNLSYFSGSSYGYSPFANQQNLSSVIFGNTVTSLYSYLLYNCSALTSITIPNSVTAIGSNAFYNCTGLSSVRIPNSVTSIGNSAFSSCTSLSNVTIGNSVISIGSAAFFGCSGLTSVRIPNSVTSIGNSAFSSCTSLSDVTIGKSVTSIGDSAFYGCSGLTSVTIPNSVTSIGNYAFSGCSSIKEVTIEDGESTLSLGYNSSSSGQFGSCPLETVYVGRNLSYFSGSSYGYSPFANQQHLSSVILGNHVTSMDSYLLYNCSGLTSVTIGNSVISIGNSAFNGCSALTHITIPNSVTSIRNSAFYGCTGLERVNIIDLDAWCKISFGNEYANPLYYAYNLYLNDNLVEELEIPNTVTSIKSYTFYNCRSIKTLSMSDLVTSISPYAFNGCSSLTDAILSNALTSIPDYCFAECSALTNLRLGTDLTSINNTAFQNCSSLAKIVSLNPTPPVITTQVFSAVNKETCLLVVTKGNLVYYWLDPVWKEFLNMSDDLIFLNPLPATVYGADPVDLSLYAPEGITLTYESSNEDVAIVVDNMLSIVGAGTATIGAIYDTNGTPMEIIGQMRQFVIEKADLSLTPMDCTIEYGSAIPEFTLLVDGLCYDDTLEDIGELPEFYCEADEDSEPGEYPIYLVGGVSNNYNLNLVAGTLKIVDKSEETSVEKFQNTEDADNRVKVFNLNGVLIYEGLKDDMNLSSGVFIIVTDSGKTYKIIK